MLGWFGGILAHCWCIAFSTLSDTELAFMTTSFLGLFTLSLKRFCCWNLEIFWDIGSEAWWNFINRFITLSTYAWLENRKFDILPLCSSLWLPHWLSRGAGNQWGSHTARFRQMGQTKPTGIVPQSSTEHTDTELLIWDNVSTVIGLVFKVIS